MCLVWGFLYVLLYNVYFILCKLLCKWYYPHSVHLKSCPWACVNISLLVLSAIKYFMISVLLVLPLYSSTPPHHHKVGSTSLGICTTICFRTVRITLSQTVSTFNLHEQYLKVSRKAASVYIPTTHQRLVWYTFLIFASLSGMKYLILSLYFSDYL